MRVGHYSQFSEFQRHDVVNLTSSLNIKVRVHLSQDDISLGASRAWLFALPPILSNW